MPENRTETTAAGIARLAGVGRAAVSNWRRRHPDFPRPVGGTDTSPSFDLAEVERWLLAQGKLSRVPLRERVWQEIESEPEGAAAALRMVGAVLLLVGEQPDQWRELAAADDRRLAAGLPAALAGALRERLGDDHPVPVPPPEDLTARLPLLRGAAELGGELGPRQAFEFLMGRHIESGPRQYTLTPAEPAALMAELAGPADLVLDPACGYGGLLLLPPGTSVRGQEADPALAALTAVRLALHTDAPVTVRIGDSLRADAFTGPPADAVLCHPPFNERAWGHEELAYDARWEYGLPPRAESELAWVQHALAHAKQDGPVVVLMPPAAASRRSGRRIRADLLRRGALRAVIALPAGTAPPYGIPLHLWVLRRPGAGTPQPQQVLLVDTAGPAGGREKAPWQTLRTTVLDAWRAFERHGAVPELPGVARTLPVIDLLDDDVDLTPARHLPVRAVGGGQEALTEVRDRLTSALRRTAELAPPAGPRGAPAHWPMTSVGELARSGALVMRTGGTGATSGGAGPTVWTEHDVVAGGPPSGVLPGGPDEEPVLTESGDVVLAALGRGTVARVVDGAGAGHALGRGVHLLRPDPATLDPWFLAGFLRGTANHQQASSFTSTTGRLDVRRLQVPRLPLSDQRRYGDRFRTLAAFEEAQRLAARLGELLVQGLYDGLTDGSVSPE